MALVTSCKSMTVRDLATTLAGMVVVAAGTAAVLTIWLLLTAPITLYDVLQRVVRHL